MTLQWVPWFFYPSARQENVDRSLPKDVGKVLSNGPQQSRHFTNGIIHTFEVCHDTFFPRMSSVAMICCCNAAIMEGASNCLDPILSYPSSSAGYLSASAYHCLNVSFVRDVNCGSCVAKCMFPPWFYAVPHGPLLFPWDSIVGRLSLRHAEARVSYAKTALPHTVLLLGLFCAWANNCRRPAYSGHQGRV